MRRALLTVLAFVSTVAISRATRADDDIARAKQLFNAGAQAYGLGQFNAAIQAFDAAEKLVPKAAITFSLGQAHRRQYFLDHDPVHLREAMKKFRLYLDAVPEGGRRADAGQAIAEMQPLLERFGAESDHVKTVEPARLMVMSQTEGAHVSVDGTRDKALPLATEVKAGKHHVRVGAPGFFDDDREVLALDNALVPVDVTLREKPARLSIEGAASAEVTIDGRPAGVTPFQTPIELASGTHLVVVTKNGRKAFTQEIDVARDQNKTLTVGMETTKQRVASESLFVAGLAGICAGAVFTVVAVGKESDAQAILRKQSVANILPEDRASYINAQDSRDKWTKVAAISYGVGSAALVAGVLLYVFDQPSVVLPPRRLEEKSKPPPAREPAELSMIPLFSPGAAGAALIGRF
jgi:hypothetical protein